MSGYEFALCRVVLALNFFGVFIGSLVGVVLNQEPQLEAIELWKILGVISMGLVAASAVLLGWNRRTFSLLLIGTWSLLLWGTELGLDLAFTQLLYGFLS